MGFEKGNKLGTGRPPKAEEEKSNYFILNALKRLNSLDTDDEAKELIVKKMMETQRGQLFIAEHIFGKAPQEIKQTNINLDEKDLTADEIKQVVESYKNAY